MPIILCKVFPGDSSKKRPASSIIQINEHLQNLAKNYPQVTLLDTWALFANAEGNAKSAEFPDLLHPNDQ